ncbi:TonB-dependent receptor plug domain-containing protein [Lysobacter sp. 1R34A]|uniref:TonB-dependent receptor plug domain-containing protein n=1 Tax=Lysobacter sp. 1R34A TaxID=3445786 RepID=UPI003EED75A6
MTFKTTKLRDAITFALAVGSTALVGAAGAQEASAPAQKEATTLDRIEVTGSRIRSVDVETAQPVLSISRQQIEKQGFKSVADILQNVTAAGTPAITRSQPLSSGEQVGGTFISLRDLGSQRTLILINGRRLGISTTGQQDVSSIPASVVERIEILKDGASSIYGSDAMAGVVNIITRTNFEGAQANAYFGQYGEGDGTKETYDFMIGFAGDRGSLTAAIEYSKEDEVWAKDREFSRYPQGATHPNRGWTPVSQWGGITGISGGTRVLNPGADPRFYSNYHIADATSAATADDIADADVSNSNLQMHLINPIERKSIFVDGLLNITDNVRFRTNFAYNNRIATRQIAGYPYQSTAFNGAAGTPIQRTSYFAPVGTPGTAPISFLRRTWEVPRTTESDLDTFRFVGSIEGTFSLGDKFYDWDAGYLYNENKLVQTSNGNLSIPRVLQAVGPSFLNPTTGRVECGTLGAANNPQYGSGVGQCMPWNPLLRQGQAGQGSLDNPELQRFLMPEGHATGRTKTTSYFANLTGPIVTLPAGDLAFAVGYEYRKEEGGFSPDAQDQTGSTTNLAGGPTSGSYDVNEVYAELNVPILADMAGARELSVSLASRYSDFNTFGNTTNSKFGFKWKPIDSLLVRGTWAEGFRAPTINDLYGGGSQTFDTFADPCDTRFGSASSDPAVLARCEAYRVANGGTYNSATYRQQAQGGVPTTGVTAQTPTPFFSGSNDQLSPETSTSKTLGLVWSPGFLDGLNVSLDWWWIKIENTIVADTATQILNDCFGRGVTERCTSAFFTRDPNSGIVNQLRRSPINAGFVEAEGFDFEASYRFETQIGKFDVSWQNTYVSKNIFKSTTNPNDVPQPTVGISSGQDINFRIRSNLNVMWEKGPWGITYGARYYSGVKEQCLSNTQYPSECDTPDQRAPWYAGRRDYNKLGSNTFHDVQFRFEAPWNATVAIGANNVFNHLGPQMYSQPNSNFAYSGTFDIGRFVYMKYQQRF